MGDFRFPLKPKFLNQSLFSMLNPVLNQCWE